ncbi:MAG: threonine aldolase family protein [Phenylobacterium sp.]|uniref:threonine aldolase family protein n=1 Tax=Phenylobacterium sp. TaxID=1871053 RepID=UPI00391ADDE3
MIARYDFASDNTAPAAPEAIAALNAANAGFAASYGADATTARAADLIRELLDADAEVRFVTSGTAANSISLAALCRPFEAVLAHRDSHVAADETGAPAFFGHGLAIRGLSGASGRIEPAALQAALTAPESAHAQPPAALSLTQATEYGTVYSADDLGALIGPARGRGCGVHLDGARLANAMAAGFDPKAIQGLGVDLLVIGGTKAGMTPVEAIVLFRKDLVPRFDARLKQSGQLPSKSRYYAAPFVGMLQDGSFVRRAAHANAMAQKLAGLTPFPLRHPVEANGVFVEMDDAALKRLHAAGWAAYRFIDGSVRFMCSWATTEAAVEELAGTLRAIA